MLEPVRRDSGPAVAVAALLGAMRDAGRDRAGARGRSRHPQARRVPRRLPRRPRVAAAQGQIVTFGIAPTHPATNYGYIRPGAALDGAAVLAVEAFVEKPDAATAAGYVAEDYLWNSGNFLFQRRHHAGRDRALRARDGARPPRRRSRGLQHDLDFLRLAAEPFARAPKKSIDYAVMERTRRAAVVPADLGWSDVGSWGAVWDVLDRDRDGNAVEGPVVVMDSRNSLVRSDDSVLTTVVGLDNVVVVATADAVLVASRDKSEGVKALVEQLKAQNRRAAVEHRRIYRPWGYYQDVDLAERYQVKRIVVKPGSKLSLQKHFHRSEHWVVVKGIAEVTVGDRRPQRARERVDLHSARKASTAWPIPAASRSN